MQRKTNEAYLDYVERVSNALSYGEIGYQEWSKLILGDSLYSDETLRRCSLFLGRFLYKLKKDKFR